MRLAIARVMLDPASATLHAEAKRALDRLADAVMEDFWKNTDS